MEFGELSHRVIGCAIEVHKCLGPGLLESVYEQCLAFELSQAHIDFKLQHALPVNYKGAFLDCGYRADFIVQNELIIELKCVEKLLPIHDAQLLTYMKMAKVRVGLLMNFNVAVLKEGIKRMVL
jgi:GxxExxY protein